MKQENEINWIKKETWPLGSERQMLLWVVWPECGRRQPPEVKIGWWKHGPACFSIDCIENANHLVTHYAEITEPTL